MSEDDDKRAPSSPHQALAALMVPGAAPGGAEEGELMSGLPFSREIGMRLIRAADGVAELAVPYGPDLVGDPATGIMHGGVVTALLDTACGTSVMASKARPTATATLDLRIDYMRPASPGETVIARAECFRLTRSVAFARAIAYHRGAAEPIASATGTFILEGKSPAEAGDTQ